MITEDMPGTVRGPHGVVHYLHALAKPQAICLGEEYDEDDVPRACRWVGPIRTDDEWKLAEDDAIQHLHREDGRCAYCEECHRGRP